MYLGDLAEMKESPTALQGHTGWRQREGPLYTFVLKGEEPREAPVVWYSDRTFFPSVTSCNLVELIQDILEK